MKVNKTKAFHTGGKTDDTGLLALALCVGKEFYKVHKMRKLGVQEMIWNLEKHNKSNKVYVQEVPGSFG